MSRRRKSTPRSSGSASTLMRVFAELCGLAPDPGLGRHYGDDDFTLLSHTREITLGGHEYTLLSLATHRRDGKGWKTDWHRLIAWNTDRGALHPARLCRKGDRVQVTGYRDRFTY